MDGGSVCLALDSVLKDLRFVNKQTLLLPHYADFDEKMPDLDIFSCTLDSVKKSLDHIENVMLRKDTTNKMSLDDLISRHTRSELEFMLMNYVDSDRNDTQPDFDYVYIKTCVYMVRHLKQMKMKHYGQQLKCFKNDHVKAFIHVVDINLPRDSSCWNHLLQKINRTRELCKRIDARLAEFRDLQGRMETSV
uniref:Uncharacterized protein n=1 Tax=Spodoptera exigua multiple nucleopolyhedrovirus TaxID=10454 RepID=A0A6N0C2Y4_9ABAC|nr:hypothetical protein [Spodoptera exigua multiple nucleopolyhedrovirus]